MELRLDAKDDLGPVRLWRVALDVGAEDEARLRDGLAADERARAEGFSSEVAKRRYVVARGTLRVLLGELLGKPPSSVRIETGPGGKPRLVSVGHPKFHFNITHSGDLALICVADREVGVDLEAVRPVPSAVEIARRYFAPAETRFVEEGEATSVDHRFLICWTRKEALAKAVGAGLSFDLRSFTVPLEESSGIVPLAGPDSEREQRWSVLDVPMGPEHVAALALPASAVSEGATPSIDWFCKPYANGGRVDRADRLRVHLPRVPRSGGAFSGRGSGSDPPD